MINEFGLIFADLDAKYQRFFCARASLKGNVRPPVGQLVDHAGV